MFTGIIENVAKVTKIRKASGSLVLSLKAPKVWKLRKGQSISIDGICMTVSSTGKDWFEVEAMPETLAKTKLGKTVPKRVNLEKA